MKTLFKNLTIIPMTQDRYFFNGDILVDDDKISYVGSKCEQDADVVRDMSGYIALPSFVNAHTHLAMTLMRNYKDTQANLQEWLSEIFPIEDKLVEDDIYSASLVGLAEMIRSGVTTFADMYFMQWQTVRACKKAKMRAIIGQTLFGSLDDSIDRLTNNYPKIISELDNDPLFRVDFAPHAIYTCSSETYLKAREYALKHNALINTHLSETQKEVDDCIKEHNMRPVEYLNSLNIFDSKTYLAHGIYFNDDELKILKEKSVSIVHNPSSNCKLASGVAPIHHYREKGINVCLGTDGASSNNNLSIVKEMRLAMMLNTVSTMKPMSTTPYNILEMATINGARALSLDDRIGTLEEGKDADFILINKNKANLNPLNDIFSALVFALDESNIEYVYCRGNALLDSGKLVTVDEEEAIRVVNERWKDILLR